MAKKKKPDPKPQPQPQPDPTPVPERACFACDGTGQMCNICGESERVCRCEDEEGDYPDFRACKNCEGTGMADRD
jgi:hypothetical protein